MGHGCDPGHSSSGVVIEHALVAADAEKARARSTWATQRTTFTEILRVVLGRGADLWKSGGRVLEAMATYWATPTNSWLHSEAPLASPAHTSNDVAEGEGYPQT